MSLNFHHSFVCKVCSRISSSVPHQLRRWKGFYWKSATVITLYSKHLIISMPQMLSYIQKLSAQFPSEYLPKCTYPLEICILHERLCTRRWQLDNPLQNEGTWSNCYLDLFVYCHLNCAGGFGRTIFWRTTECTLRSSIFSGPRLWFPIKFKTIMYGYFNIPPSSSFRDIILSGLLCYSPEIRFSRRFKLKNRHEYLPFRIACCAYFPATHS